MSSGENLRPERGGFTLRTEMPQNAVEPKLLGEFVEVVVRVPIDRDGDPEAVWGYPDDWSGEQIVRQIADAYHTLGGYLADAIDTPGTKVAFRLRSKGRDGDDVLFVDKAIENPWGGGVGDAGEG